jgi:hypothetical protein
MESFPKNLALLKRADSNLEVLFVPKKLDDSNQRDISLNSVNQVTGDSYHNFCDIHPIKIVEAFCVEDKTLL